MSLVRTNSNSVHCDYPSTTRSWANVHCTEVPTLTCRVIYILILCAVSGHPLRRVRSTSSLPSEYVLDRRSQWPLHSQRCCSGPWRPLRTVKSYSIYFSVCTAHQGGDICPRENSTNLRCSSIKLTKFRSQPIKRGSRRNWHSIPIFNHLHTHNFDRRKVSFKRATFK